MTSQSTAFQFARVVARPRTAVDALLAEANRDDGFASHVPRPEPPTWKIGNPDAVRDAVEEFMARPVPVLGQDGTTRLRKQRSDSRCLVDCVFSYPVDMETLRHATAADSQVAAHWLEDTLDFAYAEFSSDSIKGAVLHLDETYLHVHCFMVGSADRIHPGLKAERENGRRIEDGKERVKRHRRALSEFLDRFQQRVGNKYGHQRKGNRRPFERIESRAIYLAIREAEAIQRLYRSEKLEALLDKAWNQAAEVSHPLRDRMR